MRAVTVTHWGEELEDIHVTDWPEPLVGPDQLLISVAACGVNPVDWKVISGGLQGALPSHLPMIPGWDVAGTVLAVGPAIHQFQVGDRVAAYDREDHVEFGTYAERTALPDRTVAKVPDSVPLDQAAALPLAGLTAQQTLDSAGVSATDTVLILNAAGGVGSFASQLAQLRGARVLGSASPGNFDRLSDYGITPIDFHDLPAQVGKAAPAGVDVIIDLIGGAALTEALPFLQPEGRVASIADGRQVAQLSPPAKGSFVFVRPNSEMLGELLQLVAAGSLRVDISDRFSFEDAGKALACSQAGHASGKILLEVDPTQF